MRESGSQHDFILIYVHPEPSHALRWGRPEVRHHAIAVPSNRRIRRQLNFRCSDEQLLEEVEWAEGIHPCGLHIRGYQFTSECPQSGRCRTHLLWRYSTRARIRPARQIATRLRHARKSASGHQRLKLRTGAAPANRYFTSSTCSKSSSTGVARPKIETETLTRFLSKSSSSTTPVNELNGPSSTFTESPIS